ncbi:helix-turn-helix transcriptional regulator [Sulfitobacter mediterraneus]|uniref:helix-turn-helix transcriptional regulator n=1 Tax=Sulfitobacter mediterraneus TaxID=83219 RepID=UPI0021684546|nr:helix-turn-helix domain-containing protein [Sulfitobacter mediterraneus]
MGTISIKKGKQMTSNNDERLLTRGEVQDRFGIPKRFLEVLTMKGEGPPIVRLGRSVRYRPMDVAKWISRQVDLVSND